MDQQQLHQLIIDAKNGEDYAYSQLFQMTISKMHFYARTFLRDENDVEEVIQSAYISAFEHIDSLQNDDFDSWMKRIVKNKVIDLARSKKAQRTSTQTDLASESLDDNLTMEFVDESEKYRPEVASDKDTNKRVLFSILDQLPSDQRMAISLVYLEGYKQAEAAEILNINLNTLKSKLKYGMNKVKDAISEMEAREGVRYHAIAPIPLLIWLFRQFMEQSTYVPYTIVPKSAMATAAKADVNPVKQVTSVTSKVNANTVTTVTKVASAASVGAKTAGVSMAVKVGLGAALAGTVGFVGVQWANSNSNKSTQSNTIINVEKNYDSANADYSFGTSLDGLDINIDLFGQDTAVTHLAMHQHYINVTQDQLDLINTNIEHIQSLFVDDKTVNIYQHTNDDGSIDVTLEVDLEKVTNDKLGIVTQFIGQSNPLNTTDFEFTFHAFFNTLESMGFSLQ